MLVSDEDSQELDGKVLHTLGNDMKHGCVPIGDGAVDKATVLVHSKSAAMKLMNPADYDKVVKENEQLKETNEILHEENSVNRALIMVFFIASSKEHVLVWTTVTMHLKVILLCLLYCSKCILILEKNHLQSCCGV